ncbi:hypothetical protein GALL_460560 [mine drainage metagenome]|uniref:Uncharacterized protein n=1 Tax=mine drainage metagenome TaxID=410659 RepID=A0A1J5PMD6_9ZZZZ
MATARGAAFTTAVRMVDRIHGDTPVMRLAAEPAVATGLADRDVHVIGVRYRADGAGAAAVNQALLAGVQTDDHIILVAADDLRIGAGGTRELTALADLQFHIVDDGADRHVAKRHDVARLHVDIVARDHGVADRKTLRRKDVRLGAVRIFHQRDEGGAVRIVLQPLDRCRHVDLGALEVDDAIRLLVTAAAKAHDHAAGVVAAAGGLLALGQRLDRLALVERRTIDHHQLALARCRGVVCFQCHRRIAL